MIQKNRCAWVNNDPLYIKYHDEEWGIPIYNDTKLFEYLILEGAQACYASRYLASSVPF